MRNKQRLKPRVNEPAHACLKVQVTFFFFFFFEFSSCLNMSKFSILYKKSKGRNTQENVVHASCQAAIFPSVVKLL